MPMAELRRLVDWYASDWGPVDWRDLRTSEDHYDDVPLGRMLHALSLIEADSQVQRQKLSAAGADKSDELLEFIAIWLAEEGEHSRALERMSVMHGYEPAPLGTRTVTRDFRALLTWPSLYMARGMQGICASYCTLGAMQELVALTTYHHLSGQSPNDRANTVLRAIGRQESRHMRFYRKAAELFLTGSPAAQRTTRMLIGRLWRPPGMDLLGDEGYEKVFEPILTNRRYATKLLRADRIVSGLPGIGQVRVMRSYLESHGYDHDVEPPAIDPDE